jgi:hypothetical protein
MQTGELIQPPPRWWIFTKVRTKASEWGQACTTQADLPRRRQSNRAATPIRRRPGVRFMRAPSRQTLFL